MQEHPTTRTEDAADVAGNERGAALPIVALMLFVLLGLSAFAVDLGWFYLNATKVQRAADAAALAGVIHMPDDFEPNAVADARQLAAANGYIHDGAPDSTTTVDVREVTGNRHRLEVEITDQVETFFLRVFGQHTQTVSRTAVAQHVQPLPMGSPANQFGDSPGCWLATPPSGAVCNNFVGMISGHLQGRGYGDLYSPWCDGWQANASCSGTVGAGGFPGTRPPPFGENPRYRDRGYLYAVDVPPELDGHNITLELLSPGNNTGHQSGIGDSSHLEQQVGPRHTITWTLHDRTTTPLDMANNTPLCGYSYGPNNANSTQQWAEIPGNCHPNNGPGIYPLQVQVDCTECHGHNMFSIRATANGGVGVQPRVYALGDMAIFVQQSGLTRFHFAEVEPVHAGKTLVLELWDAGDSIGGQPLNSRIQILGPGDGEPEPYPCYFSSTHPVGPSAPGDLLSTCTQDVDFDGVHYQMEDCDTCYNNHMITFRVPIPAGYSCGTDEEGDEDCWWRVRFIYDDPTASPTDGTTWQASIEGNPIHLVPSN